MIKNNKQKQLTKIFIYHKVAEKQQY